MMSSKLRERDDWFDLWFEDKKSMVSTMVQNMASDLKAGYDFFGDCIKGQRKAIEDYKEDIDRTLDMFKAMDEAAVNRWCFYDMKKRGAID